MSLVTKMKSKSVAKTIQMIRQIKDHPELWQTSHKRYKDKLVKERAWKAILKALNKEGLDLTIRKRWKNLKDTFRKELKRILANEVEESPWQYFEELSFLTETMLRGIVGKNGDDKINMMTSSISNINNDHDGDSDDPLLVKKERMEMDPEPSASVDVEIDTGAPVDCGVDITAMDSSSMVTAMKGDADYMFLVSLLPTMRKLTDLQKLQFRGKVNQWLLDTLQENQKSYGGTNKTGADSDDSFDR